MRREAYRPTVRRRFKRDHGCNGTGGAKKSRAMPGLFCVEGNLTRICLGDGVRPAPFCSSAQPSLATTVFDSRVTPAFGQTAEIAPCGVLSLRWRHPAADFDPDAGHSKTARRVAALFGTAVVASCGPSAAG